MNTRILSLLLSSLCLSVCAASAQTATPPPASALLTPAAPDPVQSSLARLTTLPSQMFQGMFLQWRDGMNLVWQNPKATPAQMLAALGNKGAAMFALSAQAAAFLEQMQPGCTAGVMSHVRPVTINADGIVTLVAP